MGDLACPCVDGEPDPCTLCGVGVDGVCGLGSVVQWRHEAAAARARVAELEAALEEARTVWLVDDGDGFTVAACADEATAQAVAAKRRGASAAAWRVTTADEYGPALAGGAQTETTAEGEEG